MVMTDEKLYTVAEAAALLRVNPFTIRRWLRDGRLRGFSMGSDRGGWRIRRSELDRFIARAEGREEPEQ